MALNMGLLFLTCVLPSFTSAACGDPTCLVNEMPSETGHALLQAGRTAMRTNLHTDGAGNVQQGGDGSNGGGNQSFSAISIGGIGSTAPLTEDGYQQVGAACCHQEMAAFTTRVVDSLGLVICSQGGFSGLVIWYSCGNTSSLERLRSNLQMSTPPAKCAFVAKQGSCPAKDPDCRGVYVKDMFKDCAEKKTTTTAATATEGPTTTEMPMTEAPTTTVAPTTSEVSTTITTTQRTYCVRVTTGALPENAGFVEVEVNIYNEGMKTVAPGQVWAAKSLVVEKCYAKTKLGDPIQGMRVTGNSEDSWLGSVEYSHDSGKTWYPAFCYYCSADTEGTDGSQLAVTNKGTVEDDNLVATRCTSGRCSLSRPCASMPTESECEAYGNAANTCVWYKGSCRQEYTRGANGQGCPQGTEIVTTKKDCEHAGFKTFRRRYRSSSWLPSIRYPPGCYAESTGYTNFNSNMEGSPKSRYFSICKIVYS